MPASRSSAFEVAKGELELRPEVTGVLQHAAFVHRRLPGAEQNSTGAFDDLGLVCSPSRPTIAAG
jgi:hypothetical protein